MLTLKDWAPAAQVVQPTVPFNMVENTVAAFRVGSHSHGTHIPPTDPNGIDDTDYMLIVVPPVTSVLGLTQYEGSAIQKDGLDVVVYEWSKWLRLLLKQNPNVIGTLWLEQEDSWFEWMSEVGQIVFHRKSLLTKAMYPAFVGYAKAQLHKMTHHVHQGYMGEKRSRLVEQYGYDVKNAAHLVRLLRMAVEAIETGHLQVKRPDANQLIEIKSGKWTLAQVETESSILFERAEKALRVSPLLDAPDPEWIDRTATAGYLRHWGYEE